MSLIVFSSPLSLMYQQQQPLQGKQPSPQLPHQEPLWADCRDSDSSLASHQLCDFRQVSLPH